MTYHKEIIQNENYDALFIDVNNWKSQHTSVSIVSETITYDDVVYSDTIIYINGED